MSKYKAPIGSKITRLKSFGFIRFFEYFFYILDRRYYRLYVFFVKVYYSTYSQYSLHVKFDDILECD